MQFEIRFYMFILVTRFINTVFLEELGLFVKIKSLIALWLFLQ